MENIKKFGYEDLKKDLELEIFGLKFEIGVDISYLKKISDYKIINPEEVNDKLMEKFINDVLGENAYSEISEKYYKDKGIEIDLLVWTKVIYFVQNELENYLNRKENATPNRNFNRRERRNNRYNKNRYRRY